MVKMNNVFDRALAPMRRLLGRRTKDAYDNEEPPKPMLNLNRIVTIMVRRPGRVKEYRVLTRKMNHERASFFTKTELKLNERLKCGLLLNRGINIEFDARVTDIQEKDEMYLGTLDLTVSPHDLAHLELFLEQLER